MNLISKETNFSLFLKIKTLVTEERRLGTEILELLQEIERRKAYAELKYDGLYTYCIKELGFTDSQAYQRIQAMRALNEIPELKNKINSGVLSVTSISKAQVHLKREKKLGKKILVSDKLALFQALENKTSRQVDQTLAEARGEKFKRKITLELDEELEALWEKAKNLSAHKTQGRPEEILKLLLSTWLQKNDSEQKKSKPQRGVPSSTGFESMPTLISRPTQTRRSDEKPNLNLRSRTRYIPARLKLEIRKRDQGKCTNCSSSHALEIDHVKPFALGGESTRENLRLLCRNCNQYRAKRDFGCSGKFTST